MSKISLHTEIDTKTFLAAAAELKLKELEEFARDLNALITRKKAKDKSYKEKRLLQLINQTALEEEEVARYKILLDKLQNEEISEKERQEYLAIATKEENLRNKRVKYLIELATLKNVPLPKLMKQLGLQSPLRG